MKCGSSNSGLTCDREPGHSGNHRGYRDQQDEVVFWNDADVAEEGKHTTGEWVFSSFCKPDGSPLVTVEDVAETIAGSARHSDRVALFGVSLNDGHERPDGLVTVICYTGNGPNAHNNAAFIANAQYVHRENLRLRAEIADLKAEHQREFGKGKH